MHSHFIPSQDSETNWGFPKFKKWAFIYLVRLVHVGVAVCKKKSNTFVAGGFVNLSHLRDNAVIFSLIVID